jgi:hypothetical protein
MLALIASDRSLSTRATGRAIAPLAMVVPRRPERLGERSLDSPYQGIFDLVSDYGVYQGSRTKGVTSKILDLERIVYRT